MLKGIPTFTVSLSLGFAFVCVVETAICSCVAGPDSSSAHEKYEFDDYIFAFTTEMNGKITTELELENELEENSMTVYVKTISGKTIRTKFDKKQKAYRGSEKVEMKHRPLEV